jgi:hypothetical protein
MDADRLSEALIIYTGRRTSPFPVRSVERLSEHLGSLAAADLATEVTRLDEEFYATEPTNDESLDVAADRAAAIFATRHPDLTSDAVDALRWCYTYDWK